MPLARLDASGDRTDQGGLGTQDDQAPPTIKTEAAHAGQTGATGPNHSKPAANDAESLYWASLNQQAEQKAQALAIEGWGTGTDGPARQTAQAKIAEVYYFHTDQVGLPEELSNSQGQLVWQATYKTWGNTQAEEWKLVEADGGRVHSLDAGDQPENEARQQNLRFQGQYLDRDTGLHYNTFRYYDPDIGRFISPDPIGLMGGINLESYGPNPVGWIDPLGFSTLPTEGSASEPYILFNETHKDARPSPKGTGPNGGRLQSHHGLQQQWAIENLPGYDPAKAPTVTLETGKGFAHTAISNEQNTRRDARVAAGKGKWGTTLQQELRNTVNDLKKAGFGRSSIQKVMNQQYSMLNKLGVSFKKVRC